MSETADGKYTVSHLDVLEQAGVHFYRSGITASAPDG